MSKKKKPAKKKPRRAGRPVTAYLDAKLFEAFEQYRRGHEHPPSKKQILNAAVREYLQRRGVLPKTPPPPG